MIGLADCNSFYASCEKLFRPDLRNKPVVVLSNNDGCIVALSKEAKDLGIIRGEALFKCKDLLEKNHVAIFSSNYTLYQDISDRIVNILKRFCINVEPYSIDESFFTVPTNDLKFAKKLHYTLLRYTGMEISVGVARTKTLAKIANHIGKKQNGYYYLSPTEEKSILEKTPIDDIWGIGRSKLVDMLHLGIKTAWDLTQYSDEWIRKKFSINTLRTAIELRGTPCITEEDFKTRSFSSSISFDSPRTSFDELLTAVSCHCAIVSEKLISHKLVASFLYVQVNTSFFKENYYVNSAVVKLAYPSYYLPTLIQAARLALMQVYKEGLLYKASRVGVYDLQPIGHRQYNLFDSEALIKRLENEDKLSPIISELSKNSSLPPLYCGTSYGQEKIKLASREYLSPRYTTNWEELPLVY